MQSLSVRYMAVVILSVINLYTFNIILDFIMTYSESNSYYSSVFITIWHADMPSGLFSVVLRNLKERKNGGKKE